MPAYADQYLCTADKATGFAYNKKTKAWDYTQFKTNVQYVISPAKDGNNAFTWTAIGGNESIGGSCKDDFNVAGILFCNTFGGQIRFNRNNGRYLMDFTLAYYTVGIPGPIKETDEDSGTPMLQIGKCVPF